MHPLAIISPRPAGRRIASYRAACGAMAQPSRPPDALEGDSRLDLESDREGESEKFILGTRRADANFLERLTFWYVGPLLKKGKQSPLEQVGPDKAS